MIDVACCLIHAHYGTVGRNSTCINNKDSIISKRVTYSSISTCILLAALRKYFKRWNGLRWTKSYSHSEPCSQKFWVRTRAASCNLPQTWYPTCALSWVWVAQRGRSGWQSWHPSPPVSIKAQSVNDDTGYRLWVTQDNRSGWLWWHPSPTVSFKTWSTSDKNGLRFWVALVQNWSVKIISWYPSLSVSVKTLPANNGTGLAFGEVAN